MKKASGRKKVKGSETSQVLSNARATLVAREPDPPALTDLLSKLRTFDALRDSLADGRQDKIVFGSSASSPPAFAPEAYMEQLPKLVRKALGSQDIEHLYSHQAEAIDAILRGNDVVLEAPTATGKTLCFNIPLVLSLADNPRAHALMVHPMKALSNDQRRQFESLAGPVSEEIGRPLESWTFDGDSEPEHRKLLKASPPSVLFTNPEMLHLSFLQYQDHWQHFLKHLRLVIIDEIHEYRGYFGTNVALLLRRFFARLHQIGVHPQVVLATATCGNAKEHAYRITGRQCTLIRAKGGMRPERHFAFIDPDIPDFKFHEIYRLRIARAALACSAQGLNTLIFCPSRKFAEEAAMRAKSDAEQLGIDPETIVPYRSGYGADLRREIENGLRTGRFRAVFTTNALEIGIDIGRLDACILAGFPDSVLSAWQRIGRVGRSFQKPAYVLFYAFNNPFDRFFASNIDAFLDKPLDEILIGVDNEELMSKHLPYFIHESGPVLTDDLRDQVGTPFLDFCRNTMAGKKPVQGRGPNYFRLSIRGGSGTTWRLMYKGKEIGTISDIHLFREAYVGAIYKQFGKAYRVVAHGAGEVSLEDVEPYLRTEGIFYNVTQGAEMFRATRYAEALVACYGRVTVFENFGGYRLIDGRTDEQLDEQRSQLGRSSNVRGFWLEVPDPSVFGHTIAAEDLFGIEQLLRIGAPFVIPCDRHDLATLTVTKAPPSVYLYETVPGGIGVTEKALHVWPTIVQTAIKIAENCGCKHGCPSCLVPLRLPSGFEEPKKEPTIFLARQFLQIIESATQERFDPTTHAWVPV